MNCIYKNKIILFCSIFSFIILIGCGEDFLQRAPLSAPNVANYYQDENQIEGALVAAYSQFASIASQLQTYADFKSDNFKYYQYVQYSYSTNNYDRWESPLWSSLFRLIFRSNQVINYVPEGIDNADQYVAEARFLRAYAYFWLVRCYGMVPIVTTPLTRDEAINMERDSEENVYLQIENDLMFSIENLPLDNPLGRANKYVAEAVLAKAFIAQSGYPLNNNRYEDAIPLLEDIIQNSKYQLENNYADIFNLQGEKGAEIIWSAIMDSDQKGKKHSDDYLLDPNAGVRALCEPEFAKGEDPLLGNLWLSFEDGDIRRDVSLDSVSQGSDGIWQNQVTCAKYKYGYESGIGWTSDYIFIRYANILLLYAEVLHQTGHSSIIGDKWSIVNSIRNRAGLPDADQSLNFMEILLEERRHEFIWEGVRWFDLVRTNTFIEKLKHIGKENVADFWKYMPIPVSEMDKMSKIWENNDGY